MIKKLKLEDLKIGMRVNAIQLDNIYDTYIILNDISFNKNKHTIGTIAFIGETVTDDAANLFTPGASICTIYKEKAYYDGDVDYDE